MTFEAPDIDYAGLSPVLALTVGVVLALVVGLFGSGRRQRIVVSIFGLGTLAAAAGLCIWRAIAVPKAPNSAGSGSRVDTGPSVPRSAHSGACSVVSPSPDHLGATSRSGSGRATWF